MRTPLFLLVLLLVIAGCARDDDRGTAPAFDVDAVPTADDTLAAPTADAAATATYACDTGATIEVSYEADRATVRYEGRDLAMQSSAAASGARYVGDGYVWWSRGSGEDAEGTLYRDANGEPGETVASCQVQADAPQS
jgi:membrane-bound inhibitor of C-type lysozyme